MVQNAENLVWIDLEMSGLDPEICTILEIATIVTDKDLNILAQGPNLAITQPIEVLESMDEWNTTHHTASGLWDRVLNDSVSMEEADQATLEFIQQWTLPGKAPLCGNSIGQDRRFLYKYMPVISDHLHYRNIDVTSIKELAKRWYPELPEFKKQEKHLALDDIIESIDELKYFSSKVFIPR